MNDGFFKSVDIKFDNSYEVDEYPISIEEQKKSFQQMVNLFPKQFAFKKHSNAFINGLEKTMNKEANIISNLANEKTKISKTPFSRMGVKKFCNVCNFVDCKCDNVNNENVILNSSFDIVNLYDQRIQNNRLKKTDSCCFCQSL